MKVFAGQRDDAFFGDIGAIFDLLGFRKAGTGEHGRRQGLLRRLQRSRRRAPDPDRPARQRTAHDRHLGLHRPQERHGGRETQPRLDAGVPPRQPLINEVIIPTSLKDAWNRGQPAQDAKYLKYYTSPLLAATINTVYKLGVPATNRDDLVAVLLTGIPNVTFTGARPADMLRINLAVPVTPAGKVSRLGVLGGDNQGWPNGRRLGDDVIDVQSRQWPGS